MRLRSLIIAAALLSLPLTAGAEGYKPFIPTLHGTVRASFQQSTTTGMSRFAVHNARLSAQGHVLPYLNYFLQVDFCANGKIKPLDVFLAMEPLEGLKIYAGQMRVPFSAAACRLPHQYYFVNTPMVQPYGNLRAVGAKVGYSAGRSGFYVEGGAFNSSDMEAHLGWNEGLTWSIKANWTRKGFKPELGFMSRIPGGKGKGPRCNMANASLSWTSPEWFIEAEYIYRHYTAEDYRVKHIYSIFASRSYNLKSRFFNRWSWQARFDGRTGCERATVGATVSYVTGPTHFDLRLNYEQYFYGHSAAPRTDNNALLAGATLYF